jgi:hypothetical protein
MDYDQVERDREYHLNLIEELEVEETRRSRLTRGQRMAEDGHELQLEIDEDSAITLLVQPSPPDLWRRARCRAPDCLKAAIRDGRVMHDYRIFIVRAEREYFHVSCLESMLDLSSLAPTRFRLDNPNCGGLMMRKWFEQSRRINLDAISASIEAHNIYERVLGEYSTQYVEWQLKHLECHSDRQSCGCPPTPEPEGEPESPIFKGCITGGNHRCSLSNVLRHQYRDIYISTWTRLE